MPSKRQLDANRRNARRSTGPRTQEGRRASSLNALKHGLTGHVALVLPFEDPTEYQALVDAFAQEASPRLARDLIAVRKAADCEWRLRRVPLIEAAMHTQIIEKARSAAAQESLEAALKQILYAPVPPLPNPAPNSPAPTQPAPTPEAPSPLALIGRAFLSGDINRFATLARYEASLERQYQNAWRELDARPSPDPDSPDDEDASDSYRVTPQPDPPDRWRSSLDIYAEATRLNPPAPRDTEPSAGDTAAPPINQVPEDTDGTPAECLKPARPPLTPNTSHLTPVLMSEACESGRLMDHVAKIEAAYPDLDEAE